MNELWLNLGFIGIGVFAGFCAGLLGISGGVITVPLLTLLFSNLGFPKSEVIYYAIGTSFAATVFSALSSTLAYHRRGSVDWSIFRTFLPGIIVGSILGAIISQFLSGNLLTKLFGIFEFCLGCYFLFAYHAEIATKIPSKRSLRTLSVFIGTVSNILGIGGGTFVAPTLMAFHLPTQRAIGTSSATGLVISFLGAICYLIYGIEEVSHPYSIGYLYIPAFIMISVLTFFCAPLGTRVAHLISTNKLRKIFAIVLIVIGVVMFLE